MATVTKTMQYEIVKPVSCSWDTFGKVLRDVQHETFRIKNRVIQLYYLHEVERMAHKTVNGDYPRVNPCPNGRKRL